MDQDMNKNKSQAWGGTDEKNQDENRSKGMKGGEGMEASGAGSAGSMSEGKSHAGMDNQYSGTTSRASEGADETSEMDSTSQSARDSRYSDRNESDESIM